MFQTVIARMLASWTAHWSFCLRYLYCPRLSYVQSLMGIMELCVVDFVEANCKIVSEERGLEDICLAMGRHNTEVDLVEAACSALWSLSMEGNIRSRAVPVCLFTPNNADSWFILKRQFINLNQHSLMACLMYAIVGFFYLQRRILN